MQNRERRILRKLRMVLGFRIGRDEEISAASLVKRVEDISGTEAIAISLDRRPGRDSSAVLEPPPIMNERGSIERQAERAMHRSGLAGVLPGVEAGQNNRPPFGTGRSGSTRITSPVSSGK